VVKFLGHSVHIVSHHLCFHSYSAVVIYQGDFFLYGILSVLPNQKYFLWGVLLCFQLYSVNQTVNDGVAHSKNPRKCAYHVTFDLDLDLDFEHTLDARWPGVHLVQVWWWSGHLSARISDLRKSLQTDRRTDRQTDSQTDRRTDGRTDDGRLAIALAHSWNELKWV